MAATWIYLPKSSKYPRFKKDILIGVWKYAAAISANAFIGIVLVQLDKIILSRILPLKTFAYYTVASTVASAVWMIIVPFNTSVFPNLVQVYEKGDEKGLKVIFHELSQILAFVLVPVCAIMIIFSHQILLIWVHDEAIVKNASSILSMLAFGIMLNGFISFPGYCSLAFGWPSLITYTNCIQAIIIIPLIVFMANKYQGNGAAIALIIMNINYYIFMIPVFFKRHLGSEQKKWYLIDTALPVIVGFLICGFFYFITPVMTNHLTIFSWIVLVGIFTLIGTGLVIPFIRNTSMNYLRKKFRLNF